MSTKVKAPKLNYDKIPNDTARRAAGDPDKYFAPTLQDVVRNHVESFNYAIDEGLSQAVANIPEVEVEPASSTGLPNVTFWYEKVEVGYPTKSDDSSETRLFPTECRQRHISYSAPLIATINARVGEDGPVETFQKNLGNIPLMVKTSHCNLRDMGPAELVRHREDVNEMGGYFIVNGIEKLIRLLVLPRRNFVTALVRQANAKRGAAYTQFATSIRCVRNDQSSQTLFLHYLVDGTCVVRFTIRKQEFFIPAMVLLKCFRESTDREIYDRIVQGNVTNTFLTDRVEMMVRESGRYALFTRAQALAFIGAKFRVLLQLPNRLTDFQVGEYLLRQFVLVHLSSDEDKFNTLVFMIQKLYALVAGDICEDNADALMNHEVLLPGHLYLMYLKEKLYDFLNGVKASLLKDIRQDFARVNLRDKVYLKKHFDRQTEVGKKVSYFMATGNLISETGLDLMQVTGYSVVADKLNFIRYLSHFRSIHRGQFFAEMKTTTVRKLLPESFGFVCPVHTPDGGPCGLLNHISSSCLIICRPHQTDYTQSLVRVLCSLGMLPARAQSGASVVYPHHFLTIMLDGCVIGKVPPEQASSLVSKLRLIKVTRADPGVPLDLEIAFLPPSSVSGGPYPGLFLFTGPARMIRPTCYLPTGDVDWIGPMEQVFLPVAMQEDDIPLEQDESDVTTAVLHQEFDPMNMLSIVASLVPFADFNQSPRNMYQCQMAKQTMGTPYQNHPFRSDNKVYRIQNPQAPVVRNANHDKFCLDEYPTGCNAVVAVIAYTGYDMEDAMIINKQAYERGFGYGSVYKTLVYDLAEMHGKGEANRFRYGNKDPTTKQKISDFLDDDGLPLIGTKVRKGDPLLCVIDHVAGSSKFIAHKDAEPAVVEDVLLLGEDKPGELQKVSIKLRYNRNPVIGDKFSSRHGQKGVMSILWPLENMPFTESGMTPDVIINPNAFPSRMTIGMLVESMAGKSGCLHGMYQDSTPFRFSEKNRAVDHFGEQLRAAGFNYYGSEPMYSGIFGGEMHADIYVGVVYYQRLRHMVSDKSQVRATGPIDALTRQPVKGRKAHGGIRFGEMERDSMLAHGAAFLLHDRLMNCSDYSTGHVCTKCGSLLSPIHVLQQTSTIKRRTRDTPKIRCKFCEDEGSCVKVAMPYVFRYLANELAAMNIRVTLTVK